MLALTGLIGMIVAGYAAAGMLDISAEEETQDQDQDAREITPLSLNTVPLGVFLQGGAGADALIGGYGADEILGDAGDDTLSGAAGRDVLDGGEGNDLIQMQTGDLAYGGAGEDRFEIGIGPLTPAGAMPEIADFQQGLDRLILSLTGEWDSAPQITFDNTSLPGNTTLYLDDTAVAFLSGISDLTDADLEIYAPEGIDVDEITPRFPELLDPPDPATPPIADATETPAEALTAALTLSDQIDESLKPLVTARADMAEQLGPVSTDAITGSDNDDTLRGGAGHDAIFGNEGNDLLHGMAGADEIAGDDGNDALFGGMGNDFLDGGSGDDILSGDTGDDHLIGGAGNDTLLGGDGNDSLQGNAGQDLIAGGAGDDILDGVIGEPTEGTADILAGEAGNDTIIAGADDTVLSGEGADLIIAAPLLQEAGTAAHILDFDPNEDRVELLYDPETNPDPMLELREVEGSTEVYLDGDLALHLGQITGLSPAQIHLRPLDR
ncbi:hypothetical protein OE810_08415 [Rhodobacteraceae bacterium XHP0102]|nr:hypothetical protein [Rhodobacteraceae bacterium XHP0102]